MAETAPIADHREAVTLLLEKLPTIGLSRACRISMASATHCGARRGAL